MIEHRSAINVLTWYNRRYRLNQNRNVLLMTNYTFDPSVEQIFATLLHGATLYIIEKEVKLNKKLFTKYINDNQIHIVNMVPTLFKELLVRSR